MAFKKTSTDAMNHVPYMISCIFTLFLSTIEATVTGPWIYVLFSLKRKVVLNTWIYWWWEFDEESSSSDQDSVGEIETANTDNTGNGHT